MSSRALTLGKAFASAGAAGLGGLAPALAQPMAEENFAWFKDSWYAYPAVMVLLGGLIAWKGSNMWSPIGHGMVGAGLYSGMRAYQAEASGAGNMYGMNPQDAGNVFGMPQRQDAGAFGTGYEHQTYPGDARHYQQNDAGRVRR